MSPDQDQFVSSDSSGKVVIWDVESAMPLVTLSSDAKTQVLSLGWSSDKSRIAAGRSDGSVRIWTLAAVQ